ncbi:putative gustatory receptor 28b [Microplitis mediator]|uniref:putative gustatory receptor 28b n=1 Tax=Microplitis mediator TaxID=375433 RepID=UPI0025563288|nr:putative gustatory receptor 28b [Microplitis mediator]
MWKPKNLIEALLPIYILDLIFCHGVSKFPNASKSKFNNSFMFAVTTTIIFFICLIFSLLNHFHSTWINGEEIVYFILTVIVTLSMTVNIIHGWIYRNDAVIINSRIIKVDEDLEKLGIPVDAQVEFIFSIKIAILWIAYSLFLNVIKIVWYPETLDLLSVTFVVFTIQHGYHVNFLIDLTFCLVTKHMKKRFENLNKLLLEIFDLQTNNLGQEVETEYKWAISRQTHLEKDFTEIIHKIKRIHLELGILCQELIKIYGIPIILAMIVAFFTITSQLLYIYVEIRDRKTETHVKILYIGSVTIWFIIASLKFFSINYVCAETVNEWEQTGEIIHKLELESKDTNFQREIKQFSMQILQNPLTFTPCGLLDLGYYFVRDFAGSVTTQLIILIQTYPMHNNTP